VLSPENISRPDFGHSNIVQPQSWESSEGLQRKTSDKLGLGQMQTRAIRLTSTKRELTW